MDSLRNFMESSEFNLWTVIEHSLTLAHRDHYDELRLRREHFLELMYAPRSRQSSEASLVRKVCSDQTSTRSEVYNENVEEELEKGEFREDQEIVRSDEDQLEEGEFREDQEIVRIDESEGDKPTAQDVARDDLDDYALALEDDIEREDLFRKEFNLSEEEVGLPTRLLYDCGLLASPQDVGGKPSLDERNANPSGSMNKGHEAPSERGPSQRSTNRATTSAPASKDGLAPRPRPMVEGRPREMEYQRTTGKSDELPKPNVGAVRPGVARVINKGLATRVDPLPRDVNERVDPVPADMNTSIMRSKRKLQERYAEIETAKKARTVRLLPLTELPKGGPKAQPNAQRPVPLKEIPKGGPKAQPKAERPVPLKEIPKGGPKAQPKAQRLVPLKEIPKGGPKAQPKAQEPVPLKELTKGGSKAQPKAQQPVPLKELTKGGSKAQPKAQEPVPLKELTKGGSKAQPKAQQPVPLNELPKGGSKAQPKAQEPVPLKELPKGGSKAQPKAQEPVSLKELPKGGPKAQAKRKQPGEWVKAFLED